MPPLLWQTITCWRLIGLPSTHPVPATYYVACIYYYGLVAVSKATIIICPNKATQSFNILCYLQVTAGPFTAECTLSVGCGKHTTPCVVWVYIHTCPLMWHSWEPRAKATPQSQTDRVTGGFDLKTVRFGLPADSVSAVTFQFNCVLIRFNLVYTGRNGQWAGL